MFEYDPTSTGVHRWHGRPSHQAAHDAVLDWLTSVVASFIPPPVANPLDSRTKGNLGESIAAFIGLERSHVNHRLDGPNYLTPFSGVSRSEIDLTWLQLDRADGVDCVWLQEIKTSSDDNLSIARNLKDDYEKLFSTNVEVTLASRLQAAANRLKFSERRPDLAARVRALCATRPQDISSVFLEPTLITEPSLSAKGEARLTGVTTAIASLGWSTSLINAHLITFDDLEDRLSRLAGGNS